MHTLMKQRKNKLVLPTTLMSIAFLLLAPGINSGQIAFAVSDPPILVADHLKNNPLAIKIITEMERQKRMFGQQTTQPIQIKTQQIVINEQQKNIEENRKIAQANLERDLKSMEKEYEAYTPRNAFATFVSSINSTYHGIFWDQFDYLDAKVKLATAAKQSVLQEGGSFIDAQREYFKYASMSRIEMINVIEDLNIRYGFANKQTQAYFDANGKLPRFENDNDAPCYGCENAENKVPVSNANTITNVSAESTSNSQNEIQSLKNQLTKVRQEFLDEDDYNQKKSLFGSMNDIINQIKKISTDSI